MASTSPVDEVYTEMVAAGGSDCRRVVVMTQSEPGSETAARVQCHTWLRSIGRLQVRAWGLTTLVETGRSTEHEGFTPLCSGMHPERRRRGNSAHIHGCPQHGRGSIRG